MVIKISFSAMIPTLISGISISIIQVIKNVPFKLQLIDQLKNRLMIQTNLLKYIFNILLCYFDKILFAGRNQNTAHIYRCRTQNQLLFFGFEILRRTMQRSGENMNNPLSLFK